MTSPMKTETQVDVPSPEQYARIAERHWRTYLPSQVAALTPEQQTEFFLSKGTEVAETVEYLTEQNEEASRPSETETPLARTRRLGMAQSRAEEEALRELIFDVTKEPGTEHREPPLSPTVIPPVPE